MSAKRRNSDPNSSYPLLLDAVTGSYYTIPFSKEFNIGRGTYCSVVIESSFISRDHCTIKYENNQFIIYDNNSNSGTYINCNKILVGRNNFVVLNHGDLISFGSEKNMKLIFKFIYNQKLSNAGKKPRFNNNYAAPDVLSLNEKYKNCIKELHSGILDLKVEQLIIKNTVKTRVIELQKNLQESIKIISDSLNVLMSKQQECSIESFKTNVYALLEDYFQCPICNDVVIEASITHCNHAFCQRCILQWLAKSKNCPVCRTSLQTTTYCQPVDNYITDLCELIGGSVKEQRDIIRKEMLVSESTGNKGKKKRCTRRNQLRTTRLSNINARSRGGTIDLVDLTLNSPS